MTHCIDWGGIWRGGLGRPNVDSKPNFNPINAECAYGLPKLSIYAVLEYKCPTGANPLHNFKEICRVCGQVKLQFLAAFCQ